MMKKIYYTFLLVLSIPIIGAEKVTTQKMEIIPFTTVIYNSGGEACCSLKIFSDQNLHPEFGPYINQMNRKQEVDIAGYEATVRKINYNQVSEEQLKRQLGFLKIYNKQFSR